MFALLFKISLNKIMLVSKLLPLTCMAFLLVVSSCNDEVQIREKKFTVPSTYAFDNVDYSGQIARLDQLDEMVSYIETAIEAEEQIESEVLMEMFSNANENGGGNFSFSSSKQLSDKCFGPHVQKVEAYFDQIELISTSQNEAVNGVAGFSENNSGGIRLYDENGVELSEMIEKTIMGAVFYYQATAVYLDNDKMNVDNETVVEGQGTAMQHHWDEAYGYLGVSNDFPASTESLRFWGKYCDRRNDLLSSNASLSEAFRMGRAAIDNEEYDLRDAAIVEVRKNWEKVCVATIIHYLNEAVDNLGDDHTRNHVLSEAHVFIESLFYNPDKIISNNDLDEVLTKIGTNFYEVSAQDLQSARDLLSTIYEMDNIKSAL